MRKISLIPIAEKREDFSATIGDWVVVASYQGDKKWELTGPGMKRKPGGLLEWAEGRWELLEATLAISPVNSEAVTLLEDLDDWQKVSPTPTPTPTAVPLACSNPKCIAVSDVSGRLGDSSIGADVNGKLTNTGNKTLTACPVAIVYGPGGTILGTDKGKSQGYFSGTPLRSGESTLVTIHISGTFGRGGDI